MAEPESNGRATIREVHALLAIVDAKVDALSVLPQQTAMKLAIMETVCGDRPRLCAMEMEKAVRELADARAEKGWTKVQRCGWMAATAVALASGVIGWMQ